MPEAHDISLCGTCRYSPDCAFHEDHKFTVFHCEEFQFEEVPLRKVEERIGVAANAGADDSSVRTGNSRYRGLCTDCENHASCVFVKPEGGVWHCEEYR